MDPETEKNFNQQWCHGWASYMGEITNRIYVKFWAQAFTIVSYNASVVKIYNATSSQTPYRQHLALRNLKWLF
jgi:hypothetical protein